MEIWLWISIGVLICIIAALFIKLLLMKKDVNEIETAFRDRISSETNTLIGISHQDKSMRSLASQINIQLSKLRDERHRFQQGDKELKDAVTNISHDLRTPLTAICGYLQLLHDEKISDKAALYLEQIENRTESLKQLTEELFKYSVVTSTQESFREKTDVGRVLEECLVSFYGAMSQKNMNPEISMTDITVERFLDPNALNRIFSNIISNALKYSDGDFCVNMDDEGAVTFSNTAANLDAVTAGRLFDRFYTVQTGRNSTGLGLSIAKLLTERMGGEIRSEYSDKRLYITVFFPEKQIDAKDR